MPSRPPLVSRRRLALASLLGALAAAFNYSTQIQTPGDAASWLAVAIVVGYPVLTAIALLENRLW